jgi:glyoxylase-like metal-dependent hydrolase (beta-lactamase superfamily II)
MGPNDMHCIALKPDIHAIQGKGGRGYRQFAYVLGMDGFSVLVDATDARDIPLIEERFPPPRILLLTHWHTRQDEAEYEKRFGLSIYLHPADAALPRQGPDAGTPSASRYLDPRADETLRALGFRFVEVRGHTPGSLFIFWDRHGGVLFPGDTIVGALDGQAQTLTFPPPPTSMDEPLLQRSVRALAPPAVENVLPLHGEPIVDAGAGEVTRLWTRLVAQA